MSEKRICISFSESIWDSEIEDILLEIKSFAGVISVKEIK